MHQYYSYSPQRHYQPRKTVPHKKSHTKARVLFVLIVSVGIVAAATYLHFSNTPKTPGTTATNALHKTSKIKSVALAAEPDTSAIEQIINADTSDQIGVAIENISTEKTTILGVTAPFTTASTAKVLSAVAYYHFVEEGSLSMNTILSGYPASWQMKQMINQSNNDSWAQIINEIGSGRLSAYAESLGIKNYVISDNTLSTASMATILTKLYSGQLINTTHTKQLLSYMQNTNNETMIPAVTPSNVTLYHKYGALDDELHDTAILVDNDSAYAVVIYTKGTSSLTNRTTTIRQIAKAIISAYDI